VKPEKIVLGIAVYARAFTLGDTKNKFINSQAIGQGFSGPFTKTNGLLAYYEVFIKQQSIKFRTKDGSSI
jgi:chitinase